MGTSPEKALYKMRNTDHPHAYGDKLTKSFIPLDIVGSSPRVWGQALSNYMWSDDFRIIPTRMGTRADMTADQFKT